MYLNAATKILWAAILYLDKLHSVCGCDLIAYDNSNFGGRSLLIRQQNAHFSNDYFNDRMDSAIVQGRCQWLLYQHSNFRGRRYIVDPGRYPSPANWGGSANYISSARALPPRGIVCTLATVLMTFQHEHFWRHVWQLHICFVLILPSAFFPTLLSLPLCHPFPQSHSLYPSILHKVLWR